MRERTHSTAPALNQNLKFFIIVTGRNCERYVYECVRSICRQTYQEFEVVFIDDGSTDKTGQAIIDCLGDRLERQPGKFSYKIYPENKFASFRRYEAIAALSSREDVNGETIITTVDLDDQLHSNALDVIKKQYDKGVWMTYGNWVNQKKKINPTGLQYETRQIMNRDFRSLPYRPVSPNTFKKKLWDVIPESDYKGPDGNWLEICTETGFRLSCLELCGMHRVGIIEEAIYKYNAWLPNNTQRKYGQEYKNQIRDFVFSQPKKHLYEYYKNHPMLPIRQPEVVQGGIQEPILPDGIHRY